MRILLILSLFFLTGCTWFNWFGGDSTQSQIGQNYQSTVDNVDLERRDAINQHVRRGELAEAINGYVAPPGAGGCGFRDGRRPLLNGKLGVSSRIETPMGISPFPETYKQVLELSRDLVYEMKPPFLTFLPKDMSDFCPNYAELYPDAQKEFWAHLFTTVSYFESGFEAGSKFEEDKMGNDDNVISSGMMGISYKSAQQKPYVQHGCKIREPLDLTDPRKNIACSVAIMSYQVAKSGCISCAGEDGKFNKGGAAYWSVLRPPYEFYSKKHKKTLKLGKKPEIVDMLKTRYPVCFQ